MGEVRVGRAKADEDHERRGERRRAKNEEGEVGGRGEGRQQMRREM